MCGIFIYLGRKYSLEQLKEATQTLTPRGPDNFRYYLAELADGCKLFMGFRRLAINDLYDSGDQPMFSEDGKKVLVCNGEIYNYRDLLYKNTRSSSDCEGIIQLFENAVLGDNDTNDLSRQLDGDFAYGLYDLERKMLTVSRDPIGVRPLFLSISMSSSNSNYNEYVFASEMKAIHALNASLDVKPFLPGTSMTIYINDIGRPSVHRYIDFSVTEEVTVEPNTSSYDYMAIFEIVRHSLINAVRKRLLSDRPIGCLLSGGLDSSLIAALVQKCMRETNPEFVLHTFSVGMAGSTDLAFAKKVADHIGSAHTEVIFTAQEGIDVIPELISVLETYDVTTVRASVGMYILSRWISQNTDIKVIFSGEGADEVAQGYIYFHKAPSAIAADSESRRLIEDLHMYDVLRADRTISHWGMEARVPFLDKEFVQSYLRIPAQMRMPYENNIGSEIGRKIEKYLLRAAFRFDNLIPQEVLWRRKEAFSDGISPADAKHSWHAILTDHMNVMVPDDYNDDGHLFSAPLFEPISKEQYVYWSYFGSVYSDKNTRGELFSYIWMPKWTNTTDPSARTLSHY